MKNQHDRIELTIALKALASSGYTLDFNPKESTSASWGISTPWPSELDYEIEQEFDCYSDEGGEEMYYKVFAVKTKRFSLKGVIIRSYTFEKSWTLDEIFNKFGRVIDSIKNLLKEGNKY